MAAPQILYLVPLLVFISPSSSARTNPLSVSSFHHSESWNIGSQLIKELEVTQSGIVEKRLSLSVLGDSGATVQDLAQHAGYYRIEHTVDARMFYFFFESRKAKTDPVVIWLSGGPGCSSSMGLFFENGPFKITKNLSLVWNNYGWDKVSNIIYVDQPTGTGFSYSSSDQDIRHDETGVSNDLYFFLQAFFKSHPDYVNNDFYITGDSYAGHYIPAFATRVNQGNKNKEGIHINLKGCGIGNGFTNPAIHYKSYPDYALAYNLISKSDYEQINRRIPDCEAATKECGTTGTTSCEKALSICVPIFDDILSIAGNINYYDIRKKCEGSLCHDFSSIEQFLNESSVKTALGVPSDIDFVMCSVTVDEAMTNDRMRDLSVGIPALLEQNIEFLIYVGEYDLICNWIGNWRWVHEMVWSGQKKFVAASNVSFVVDGKEAGVMKNYGPLTFLKVRNAGHLAPMDQPSATLRMLHLWTTGKLTRPKRG